MKWKTEIVASLYSGRLLCEFGDMHQFAEWFTGEPIFTHQFAHPAFVNEIKTKIGEQIPAFADFRFELINQNNWERMKNTLLLCVGDEVDVRPCKAIASAGESFFEPLKRIGSGEGRGNAAS